MGLAVFDLRFPGIHGPFVVSPGSDDLQIRSQSLDSQFKANLVVSLAGGAVADGSGAFFSGDFHQLFSDQRSGHGGAQQIFVFIDGICLNTGYDVFIAKLVDHIFDIQFGRAAGQGTLLKTVQFLCLSAVHTDTDDFIVEVFL